MVRDNVISLDPKMSGRARVDDAKARQLVARCRAQLADGLPRLLQELFEHIDDELYQLADKSASDMLQTRYFDAMRELRKLRGSIEQDFLQGQLSGFDGFWKDAQSAAEKAAESLGAEPSDELSLVDEDELEENLAVSSMVSKAENRYHRELFGLSMRFAQLAGIPDLTARQNPVGPSSLAEGFRTALRFWDGDLGVRLVIFKLFDRYVMGYTGGLYDELNDVLVDGGILPKIVQRVRRNPVAPSLQRARQQAADSQPAAAEPLVDGGGEEVTQEHILGMLGQLLSMQRNVGSTNLYSGRLPGGGTHYPNLPAVDSHELVDALNTLQRDVSVEAPVSSADIQQLQGEMLLSLGRRLDMGTAEAPARRLNQVDQDVIDVIGMLFDFILDDGNVPEAMKALLGRLQIPMLKVAVLDRSFFGNKQHPARRLLNALARAAMAWVDDGDRSPKSLYGRIDAVVGKILGEFRDDVGLFTQLYDDFTSFMEREARGAEVAEERITQVTRGQEQLLIARRRVAEVLNEFRTTEPDLPTSVVNILREGWHDVMLLAFLREGEESAAWKHACDAVEELIWSVRPKTDPGERQKLLKAIPELLKRLRDGLNNISFDQHRAGQLFKDLQAAHIAALRGESEGVETVPAEEEIAEGVALVSPPEVEVIEDASLDQARALEIGQWLEWQEDDSPLRGKLSWRSSVTENCIFVNRKGMKVAEMTVNDIACLFRDDRARVLEDVNTPLMDRALTAMLGALKETDQNSPPA